MHESKLQLIKMCVVLDEMTSLYVRVPGDVVEEEGGGPTGGVGPSYSRTIY